MISLSTRVVAVMMEYRVTKEKKYVCLKLFWIVLMVFIYRENQLVFQQYKECREKKEHQVRIQVCRK